MNAIERLRDGIPAEGFHYAWCTARPCTCYAQDDRDALAAVDALYQAAKAVDGNGTSNQFDTRTSTLRELRAAVRRIEGTPRPVRRRVPGAPAALRQGLRRVPARPPEVGARPGRPDDRGREVDRARECARCVSWDGEAVSGRDANQLAADDVARRFHEAYERLAPEYGYETRQESAVAWEDVPEPNRSLMVAVAAEVHAELVGLVGTLQQERDEARLDAFMAHKAAEIHSDKAVAAEAALAETRRALAKYTEGAVVETTARDDGEAPRSCRHRHRVRMIVLTGLAAIVVLAWACHIHHTFPR